MLIGLDIWSSVADLGGGGNRGARASPILLGEPKNAISAEHHLEEAYEQGMVSKCWKWPF